MTRPHEPDGTPAAHDDAHAEPTAAQEPVVEESSPEESSPEESSPEESSPEESEEPSGLAWAITTRLNRFTRKFLGPAQVGERAPDTQVPSTLPDTPCASCGRPLSQHELVRTTDAKMRLYCPDPPTA